MESDTDHPRLVEQAQLGDEKCLEQLTEAAQERLRVDVYRLTLDAELTADIVQETILEMLKILSELKEADKFWPWLYRIALNKIRLHHRRRKGRKTVPMSSISEPLSRKTGQEAMSKMVAEELKEIVVKAMQGLKPRYRAVLTMRCYREMQYSAIGESLGCSEFAAKTLFWRAKKSLQKQLCRRGLGRGSLLTGLVLFGKVTAPGEAANVALTPAAVKVGAAAGIVGALGGKTAIISLATASIVGIGALAVTSGPNEMMAGRSDKPAQNSYLPAAATDEKAAIQECWYYYPQRADGPVMMRMMRTDPKGRWSYCAWRQNEYANYYFDQRKGIAYIRNCRMWRADLAVWRLPADSPELRGFVSKVEGSTPEGEYTALRGEGLLVMAKSNGDGSSPELRVIHRSHVLDGEQFRYDWPAGIRTVDIRDEMHNRGWTYFTVGGDIGGEQVTGTGRIPFVYAASKRYWPWMKLRIGERVFVDESFRGFSRPWMGLHTIDTVRRDAAEQEMTFETEYRQREEKVEIILTCAQTKVVYVIDIEKDVVDKITVLSSNGKEGELVFTYLQEIDQGGLEFREPVTRKPHPGKRRESPGLLRLLQPPADQ